MKNIINSSESFVVAIHSLVLMCCKGQENWISVQEIAQELKVSESNLSKILQKLVKLDLIQSTRGPKGGFKSKKAPEQILVLELYMDIEGAIKADNCACENNYCSEKCIFKNFKKNINKQIIEFMKTTTIKDIIDSNKQNQLC
jgi:Rrf2 family protein